MSIRKGHAPGGRGGERLGHPGEACCCQCGFGLPVPTPNPSLLVWQILLPSAVHLEERLTVSQSVPEPASRQSDRYTQFGFFVSGRCGPKQQGDPSPQSKYWPSGKAADTRCVGVDSNPSLLTLPPLAAALKVSSSGIELTSAHLVPAALPLDRWPCYQHRASPLLVAY